MTDSVIQNLQSRDPFADDEGGTSQDGYIHIRIQQRNGRKTLTTVQGISAEFDLKKIVKVAKKEFACNGTVVEHPEYGEVIQLQGDQRQNISKFIKQVGLAREDQIKVHGFWTATEARMPDFFLSYTAKCRIYITCMVMYSVLSWKCWDIISYLYK